MVSVVDGVAARRISPPVSTLTPPSTVALNAGGEATAAPALPGVSGAECRRLTASRASQSPPCVAAAAAAEAAEAEEVEEEEGGIQSGADSCVSIQMGGEIFQ